MDVYDKYQAAQTWAPLKPWMYGKTRLETPRPQAMQTKKCIYYDLHHDDSDDDPDDDNLDFGECCPSYLDTAVQYHDD